MSLLKPPIAVVCARFQTFEIDYFIAKLIPMEKKKDYGYYYVALMSVGTAGHILSDF